LLGQRRSALKEDAGKSSGDGGNHRELSELNNDELNNKELNNEDGAAFLLAHSVVSHAGSSQLDPIFESVASALARPRDGAAGGVALFSLSASVARVRVGPSAYLQTLLVQALAVNASKAS
jgi:hypothetical protein